MFSIFLTSIQSGGYSLNNLPIVVGKAEGDSAANSDANYDNTRARLSFKRGNTLPARIQLVTRNAPQDRYDIALEVVKAVEQFLLEHIGVGRF